MTSISDDDVGVSAAVSAMPDDAGPITRRHLLRLSPNPSRKRDYLTSLRDAVASGAAGVTLTYVPGKFLIEREAFAAYLSAFPPVLALETLALDILDDINNEVVPRWVEVRVERSAPGGTAQVVVAEDREPRWSNPELLARLR